MLGGTANAKEFVVLCRCGGRMRRMYQYSQRKKLRWSKPECKVSAKMLRHVVLFRFKEGTSPEQIKEVENAFASLPGKIDIIKRFEWGTNVSAENRSEGFTHCFVLSFLNEA